MRYRFAACLCLLAVLGCKSTPQAASFDASTRAPKPVPPAPAAVVADTELTHALMLHEPCPAAEQGAAKADLALDQASSAEALFRLGLWLRLREATCLRELPPARHAANAAAAFAAAVALAPTRSDYVLAWAWQSPDAPEVGKAVDALLVRDPLDPSARLWKARLPGISDDAAIALLQNTSSRCAAGQALMLGDLLRKKGQLEDARAAYRRELAGGCEETGLPWHGEDLARSAAARFGLARTSLDLKDGLEARRQLRWLDFEAVDAALPTVDASEEAELWKRLSGGEPMVARAAPRPEQVASMLELALLRGDARSVAALLDVNEHAHRSQSCEQYAKEGVGPRSALPVCLLRELLPEAPRTVGCELPRDEKTSCRVEPRQGGQAWTVKLSHSSGGWRFLSSTRPWLRRPCRAG